MGAVKKLPYEELLRLSRLPEIFILHAMCMGLCLHRTRLNLLFLRLDHKRSE